MPSKSKKQARLMAAVAHNPKFAKKVGIPQSVGRDFYAADHGYAEGGEVTDESNLDTYVKRPLAGLASMWGGIDPETGEFVNPAWHNLKRAWNADERRKKGQPAQKRATLGMAETAKALPGLAFDAGELAVDYAPGLDFLYPEEKQLVKDYLFKKPQGIVDAENNEAAVHKGAQDALGLDDPHGFTENLMDSAGTMAGQLPLPGASAKKLALLKERGPIGKVLSAGVEYLSPTINPKLKNYTSGALFGGILGGGLDAVNDVMSDKEREQQQQKWIQEAMSEVLHEEQGDDEASDDEALAELGYAEGGRVGKARALIQGLRKNLEGVEDVAERRARIEQALLAIKGHTEDLPAIDKVQLHTANTGMAEASGDLVPDRRRQRFGDYERDLLNLLENTAPRLTERRASRLPIISNMDSPPVLPESMLPGRKLLPHELLDRDLGTITPRGPIPAENAGHGRMSDEDFNRLVLKQGFAEGGAVPTNDPPNDPRGNPLSQQWFENYGAGPEHLFLGDRTVNLHPLWGPQHPAPPPGPVQRQPDGSWLPAAAILGYAAYDQFGRPRQGAEPSTLPDMADAAARDTSEVERRNQYDFEDMPQPHLNDDGSISYLQRPPGGDQSFWDRMDDQARDTSDIDAWSRDQLDHYGDTHEMPTADYDVEPGALDRAWQGGTGAFDLYGGLEQGGAGGYGRALSGAGDLYGSLAGEDAISGGLGKIGGGLAGVGALYSGIQEGGVRGYTQAASGALQTAQTLGYTGGAAGAALGKAVPIVGAALSAYGAYESAAVGDKKGAVTQGAMAGAAIGSVVPVIGTAVGAAIGAVVGLIGASLGNKEMASESYYGAYKKLDTDKTVRGWSDDEVNGAVFETIKSHTKSGNINKFKDVSEMYEAFGITKDAHKNYRNVQTQMGDFMKGAIQTAQQMGALPTDPAALKQLDGQQVYYKIIVPALAAKYKETTGKDSTGWKVDHSGGDSTMQNLFADWADHMVGHWGDAPPPIKAGGDAGMKKGKFQQKARGGLAYLQ